MIKFIISSATFQRLSKLARDVAAAHKELQDRTQPHRKIRDKMAQRWAMNFDTQGGQYGDTWEATHEATIALHGPPKATLRRTGALRSGFISQAKAPTIGKDATRWNFQRQPVYLYAMHFGWSGNRLFNPNGVSAPIPARPLWDIDGKDEEMAKEELEQYVDKVLHKYFS